MAVIASVGLATPLGLGREATLKAWEDGASGLRPNDRWPADSFPRSDAGLVCGFSPRKQLPDRKAVKLMSREAQLGVYAAVEAAGGTDACQRLHVPPYRFGAWAAAGYEVSALQDHIDMLAESRDPDDPSKVSVPRLFGPGRDAYNPLAPLRILPNMALFHAGAALGLQGPYLALGSSPAAGLAALGEATEALVHSEADAALVLGADAQVEEFRAQMLVEAGVVPTLAPGEGAAALLLLPDGDGPTVLAWGVGQEPTKEGYGDVTDGGRFRGELYERVVSAAGGDIEVCIADFWAEGEGECDETERGALPTGGYQVVSSRQRTGWMGAAQGLFDAALAAEYVRTGRAERVLVTASGLAGDVAAVVIGRPSPERMGSRAARSLRRVA